MKLNTKHFLPKICCILITILVINLNANAASSDHFVTTWKTDNPGFSNNSSITIGTNGAVYSYSVDWNNDNIVDETGITGDITHDYGTPGTYTIRIFGDFPALYMGPTLDGPKLIAIEQWGTNSWESMEGAFSGAVNLVNNAIDTPDLTNVLSLKSMFINAQSIGTSSEVANWNWDTSTVQSMEHMFNGALAFDRDISSWDVENVVNFENMFNGSTLSTTNYEALLISWAAQNINNLLNFDGGNSRYCSQTARTARLGLILNDSLTISDGGLCEEGYFITTWKTDNPGSSNSTSITIPTNASETYFYQVDWNGDGDFLDADENTTYAGDATHDYGSAGIYTMKIKGIFPHIYFDDAGDKQKILSIEQWGTQTWSSMERAFFGTSNLQMNATDTPDLSETTNLILTFALNSNLGLSTGSWNWDTTNVSVMASLFFSSGFNFDISSWNVQNVVNFNAIFNSSSLSSNNYDKLLSTWWTQSLQSNVNFDAAQIQYCSQAAQDGRAYIIANYNWTFDDAGLDPDCDSSIAANHFVITVNTENAGSTGPASFAIPTTGSGYNYSIDGNNDGIFDFTGITTGGLIINFASAGINTIRIAGDFPRIYFNEGGDKDKILSIEQWGTNQWTSMNNAFSGASNLVINATDTPDLSNVTSLFKMFLGASNLGNGTGNWSWDTSTITGMSQLFKDAVNFDKDISSWDIENVTNVGGMFTGATLSDTNYDALLISWDAQFVNPSLAFNGGNSKYCSQAAEIARTNLIDNDLWTITDAGLDPDCDSSIAANHFVITVNTENAGSTGPASFAIPTTGSGYNYSIDANNDGIFDFTGITSGWTIHFGTVGIKTVRIAGDFPQIYFNNSGDKDKILSVEQWGTNQWTSMSRAFYGASNLVINASDVPDLSQTTDLSAMFALTPRLGLGTGNWNWNTSNITKIESIFNNSGFDFDISSWNIENVTSFTTAFSFTTLSDANYDALLISWAAQNVSPSRTFNGGNSQYCSQAARSARMELTNTDLWTIIDEGQNPNCDLMFENGFEDVVIVKTAQQQINYDFSAITLENLDTRPIVIIKGIDQYNNENMNIEIRNDLGIMQVRINRLHQNQWQHGNWQDKEKQVLTTLYWKNK